MEKLRNADAWTSTTQQGAEKAARKFRECIENGGTKLDLSFGDLIEIPPEIGQLISLKWFYCNCNQLTELPPEIGQLTSLKILSISLNDMAEFPFVIGQITSLEELYYDENNFDEELYQILDSSRDILSVVKTMNYMMKKYSGRLTKSATKN